MPRAKPSDAAGPLVSPSSMGFSLWIVLVGIRILNALVLRTYFDADEYWQTIEVAHRQVFGYGWLTWEWHVGLRSYLYVLPFIGYFQLLKMLGADGINWLITLGPKMIQAIFAATVDYLVYILALRLFKSKRTAESSVSSDKLIPICIIVTF